MFVSSFWSLLISYKYIEIIDFVKFGTLKGLIIRLWKFILVNVIYEIGPDDILIALGYGRVEQKT